MQGRIASTADKTAKGLNRRSFLKFCSVVAATLGLEPSFASKIAEAFTTLERPPVLWLHMAECTGCTEAALRTNNPYFDELIIEVLSLDYHETVMAGAGHHVHDALLAEAEALKGQFFAVVEGAIPTANGGIYGMVGGMTMLEIVQTIVPKSMGVIALGTCASFGGLPAAAPNPTGAKGVGDALGSALNVPLVNISGCPPNPVNLVATLANYLLQGTLPPLDYRNRPLFAYGSSVHSRCPFRDDAGERYCLEDFGCKGRRCRNNCPSALFNDRSFPMQSGHPCIGCSEPNFWDLNTPFYDYYGEYED